MGNVGIQALTFQLQLKLFGCSNAQVEIGEAFHVLHDDGENDVGSEARMCLMFSKCSNRRNE